MCMLPWSLCGWQGIWWHLDVHTSMPRLPLIVVYMFFTCRPSLMSSLPTQLCLGCNQIFRFAPCAPHHNHLDYFHLTMGTHLLCLKSITHHGFQFGLKWRAPKSRGETHLRVSQSQVAESWDLKARSRLPTLERGRGSSWEPRDWTRTRD
jgi:hypothetical protein